ncbi:hypothetical protein B0F90DRAFT_1816689 [Multifurca ochricompacta]|uniref:Uncharacterized protein n=1 Tax=Multifurca ochricompacta TaxID=376703 RepID=A0AAD4QP29_9AGAM|nr:hypothetical protein B0F90DRAFT_1816689 [Multifurca ochricompacta]
MSPLPSFVELMSSLGLEDGASRSRNTSFLPAHAPGAYLFVPADHDRRDRGNFMDIDVPRVSRHGQGRYSPYFIASVPRKGSLPALFESGKTRMASSASPLPSPRSRASRVSSGHSPNGRLSRRGSETWLHEPDFHATTPISTFLRRKSPQMSPTSALFPRSAFDEPLAPVAIPALPALLSSFVFPPPSPEPSSPQSEDLEPQVLMATPTADTT